MGGVAPLEIPFPLLGVILKLLRKWWQLICALCLCGDFPASGSLLTVL